MHDFFLPLSMDDCHCSSIKFHKMSTAAWGESQVVHSLLPQEKRHDKNVDTHGNDKFI
jgi:hypothetical protein